MGRGGALDDLCNGELTMGLMLKCLSVIEEDELTLSLLLSCDATWTKASRLLNMSPDFWERKERDDECGLEADFEVGGAGVGGDPGKERADPRIGFDVGRE